MKRGPISGAHPVHRGGGRRVGRRTGLAAIALTAAFALVTGCGGGGGEQDGDAADGKGGKDRAASGSADAAPSRALVRIVPADGAKSVPTEGKLKVTAARGKLREVRVKDTKGRAVPGRIAADGLRWTPDRHLSSGTTYRVHAVAVDAEGRESTKESRFTTFVPKTTFIGTFTPEDGSTVGVGMPFSINFDRGITRPESVERAIRITTEPAVPVKGHWFGNDRLDFRPEKYWKPGTKVTVTLGLDGVQGRPGVYGKQLKKVSFTIGRSQVSTVDVKKKQMSVVRDGKVIKRLPITAGAPATTTYNGKMVISEKHEVTRMNGATVGFGGEYDIKDVPHAMRLSTSGTFIHGNYWAGGVFGKSNVSHGCIGLRDARGGWDKKSPAAWFFHKSLIGDVVVVKNSKDKHIQPGNGLNGWNMPWSKW
ncbi:Ig-like domain-containing protein [Streptomyces sp. NPDC059578]|uniref:L,D-transpeptidase n=1 Tax=unclassified Streptomyces TaxID=2593676 RepID=UPI003651C3B7